MWRWFDIFAAFDETNKLWVEYNTKTVGEKHGLWNIFVVKSGLYDSLDFEKNFCFDVDKKRISITD